MERALSPDERIRRAEEIYYRRKNLNENREKKTITYLEKRKKVGTLKKMINQIIICAFIYTAFFIVQNNSYVFSEEVTKKAKEILEYDIKIKEIYNKIKENVNIFIVTKLEEKDDFEEEKSEEINNDEIIIEEVQQNDSISGEAESLKVEEKIELSQMEQDAKYIIENKSLIIPLEGTITSRFGARESSNPIVTKNHTGIDIAQNQGTVFIASMSGIVEKVSSEGDLGNHIKITNGDVSTVYAHCKTIYVKEGENVNQGQQIGEVGSTGNSTGPHLHFAIKKEGRYVDPDLILKFE